MEALEALNTRRSIRAFAADALSDQQIETLLNAMIRAPSAGNMQPWRIYVIQDEPIKRKLAVGALNQNFLTKAPVVFVVCRVPEESAARYGDRGRNFYSIQDTAAMTENLLIAAHAMGLGGCWVGAFNDSAIAAALECPPGVLPVAIVPIGYPSSSGQVRSRRPLESITYYVPRK